MATQHSGVIPTAEDLFLYDKACNPAELDGARSLWLTVLMFQFPFASGYHFAPVKTPVAGNAGHIDPGVYKLLVTHNHTILPLLFIEWSRAAPDTPYGRRNAEAKILAVCNEFLTAYPERAHIYGMLCAGGRTKIWKVDQNSRSLAPLSPAWFAEEEEEEPYVDAKLDSKDLLKQAFEDIRQSRPTRASDPTPLVMILEIKFPTNDGFYHVCGSAPAPVEIYSIHHGTHHTLLLVEMRLGTEGTLKALKDSEDLILRHCTEYIAAHPDRTSIYAMVCAGTRAKASEDVKKFKP